MTSTKCVVCGIGFFSATGSNKCSRCEGKEKTETMESNHSCGCGHHH